tara:strand:+ start:1036 stop:1257 length:222 start_codon:yes stop_codon:yes gene_type:complete
MGYEILESFNELVGQECHYQPKDIKCKVLAFEYILEEGTGTLGITIKLLALGKVNEETNESLQDGVSINDVYF